MKEYIWNGLKIQIADKDLSRYPGAKPIETKEKKVPANKSRQPKNK